MIYDTFEHIENYFPKESPIYKALSFARNFDSSQPDGKYEIEGNDIYALVSSYETGPAEEGRFEAHRKYIDVQILLEGEEKIETCPMAGLKTLVEYSEPKDVLFLETPSDSSSINMRPGHFGVFFPHDIHRPRCNLYGKRHVRKIVIKVRAGMS